MSPRTQQHQGVSCVLQVSDIVWRGGKREKKRKCIEKENEYISYSKKETE